jgi:hypothetical protein
MDKVNELYLWKKHINEEKKRRNKLKDFLIGRKMVCDLDEEQQFNMETKSIKLVRCNIKCDLWCEKQRKFKFKFKKKNMECDQFEALNELFKISKKKLGNLKKLFQAKRKQKNEEISVTKVNKIGQ